MKLILATIVGGLVLFLLGWLFYGAIFIEFFKEHYAKISRGDDFKLWAIAVGCLTQALFMSLIYPHGYKGGSPVTEGLKFGILIGLLLAVPFVFFFWASFTVPAHAAIRDGCISLFNTTIAGLAIGLVYGKKSETAATSA